MRRHSKANVVAAIVLTGFFASVVFHYSKGVHLRLPYPHNTFLYEPSNRFADFYNLLDWNRDRNPYLRGIATAQYPLLNLLSYLLSTVDWNMSFWLFHALVTAGLLWMTAVAMSAEDRGQTYVRTVSVALLSYPFLFTIDRGNFESLLCVFLLLFAYCYQRDHSKWAAFFLAAAIAMKLFPVILMALLISDRKYKQTLQVIAWTLVLTLVSVASFEGGVVPNLMVLLSGSNLSNNANMTTFTGASCYLQRGISLLSVAKILICAAGNMGHINGVQLIRTYSATAALMTVGSAVYVILIEEQLWRKVTVLAFAMLLFPPISAEYKLMHVLLPLFLFVNATTDKKLDWLYVVGFSLLLISKDYVLLDWVCSDAGFDISSNMLLNPAIMLIMMSAIAVEGLRSTSWAAIVHRVKSHLTTMRAFVRPTTVS